MSDFANVKYDLLHAREAWLSVSHCSVDCKIRIIGVKLVNYESIV